MIANKKFLRGPRLGHLLGAGDAGIRIGGMGNQRAWIGRGGGNFDLRLLFGGWSDGVLWAKSPARSHKDNKEHGQKSDDKFDGGIRRPGGTRPGNAGNLRHFGLEAIRWGLVGHWAAPRFYTLG